MRKNRIVRAYAVLLLLAPVRLMASDCDTLKSTSPTGLVSYLQESIPDHVNGGCVAFAIAKLGDQRYEPAIPVLTELLDFHWPPGAHQKQMRFIIEHDGTSIYPAANALKQMGSKALPAVLETIKSRTTSRRSAEIAVTVWMTIYKAQAPTGVALLKQESDRTTDPIMRQRIAWAARKATEWCAPSEESRCETAAMTRYSNPIPEAPGKQTQ